MARPQPKVITFEIDGRQVQAAEGTMLVDAAKHGDVEIPYFCYEPKLGQPVGACRMCLVEIEGIPKLQTSCSTPVRDGMVVNTTSDRVKHAQNAIVEFLLVNHPLDCPVCDKGGECPLQDISFGWGAGHSRMIEPKRHFKKPLELSPLVAIDRERCILCYRCVRFSQEVSEDHQLVFLERGDHTFVGTHDGRPYVAPFSGNIIELCPVGALTSTAYRFRARPWDIEDAGTVCPGCAAQCNVTLTLRDDAKVVRVLSRQNDEVDDGWICDKGRFGYQSFRSAERITTPLVRDGGFLREVSWERALGEAAAALKKAGAEAAAIVGGQATNEEGFLVQRLLRDGLGSPHVDSRAAGPLSGDHARALARPGLTAKVSDVDHADAILVLDVEPVDEAPILDLRVRKAVRRNNAQLVTASARPSTLDGNATAALRFAPGTGAAAVTALAAALGSPRAASLDLADLAQRACATEGFRPGSSPLPSNSSSPNGSASSAAEGGSAPAASAEASTPAEAVRAAAEILRDAGDVVILWGERLSASPEGVEALLALAAALGLEDKPESGLIEIPAGGNGRGLREVGCLPTLAPGLADAPTSGRASGEAGEAAALLLVQADVPAAAMAQAGPVIAFADFRTEALDEHATIVFPAEIYPEKEGTITHPDGRLQRVRQALGRAGEVRPGWQVLEALCAEAGCPTGALSSPMVTAALTAAVPFYMGITLDEIGGQGVRWQECEAASAAPVAELSDEPLSTPPAAPQGLRLATAPSLWSGPQVEHSPSLRFLHHGPRAELSVARARELGIKSGDEVELSVDGKRVRAKVSVRTGVPADSVFLTPPVLPEGPVEVSRAPARERAMA
jgi:NADH-quinone oxidoreductase subunit G